MEAQPGNAEISVPQKYASQPVNMWDEMVGRV